MYQSHKPSSLESSVDAAAEWSVDAAMAKRNETPIATGQMKEFDPAAEKHFPLLLVKAVEPGCTTEWQIENLQTGEVARITTTEDPAADEAAYLAAVEKAARSAWEAYQNFPGI